MIDLGKDPETIGDAFRMDRIVELQPGEMGEAEIVWEWRFIDHVIQDFDGDKPNFGVISEHPERLDINYINGNTADFTHVNAIDYKAELDQILISPRHLNEIFIIDHSTTTEEAASSSGGNYGKGGDFLWRWGNVAGYDMGEETDQKLIMQHDAKWIEEGFVDGNKISVFSNGDADNAISTLCIIEPVFENNEYLMQDNVFLPQDYDWSWQGEVLGETVYEVSRSGLMCLENGNVIFCETSKGRVSEITRTGELVWSYVNPVGTEIYNQYEDNYVGENLMFRGDKYAVDYPGFDGQNMDPMGIIEDVNPNSDACMLIQTAVDIESENLLIQNPVSDQKLAFNRNLKNAAISIFDLQGRKVFEKNNFSGNVIDVSIPESVYILFISEENQFQKYKIVLTQ